MTPMQRFNLYLSKEQLAWLHRVAKKSGESVATIIRLLIDGARLKP